MRSRVTTVLAGLLLLVPGLGVRAAAPEVLVGGNVTFLGNIPEIGSVGGRIKTFTTSRGTIPVLVTNNHRGISAYDVSIPEVPVLLSHLPLPHFYNEDLDFGSDILITSTDPSWVDILGSPGRLGGIYIIDISDVEHMGFHYTNLATGNRWTAPAQSPTRYAGHTISCIRPDCSWAYVNGTSQVVVANLTNPASPQVAGWFWSPVGSTHDIQVDATGVAWMVGSGGVVGLDTTNPTSPTVVHGPHNGGLSYHHNSLRPDAADTLLITEEVFWPVLDQTQCRGQGRFQARSLNGTVLDTWETELQVAGLASPAVGCSAHYFDERAGLVAIAWYQQGVRILDVGNPGDIRQVGYFIAPNADAWATVWAGEAALLDGEIVYVFDQARGIDILRVQRDGGLVPVQAPILPQWLTGPPVSATYAPDPTWSWACRIPLAAA